MCILFCYTNENPSDHYYRLIIASNRDEYYKRPSRPAFTCPRTQIIGGRDMEKGREGGMWLGISVKDSQLKFGALLNVTGAEKRQATKGRGPLVYNYLAHPNSARDYVSQVQKDDSFSSFNLFLIEMKREQGPICKLHYSNSPEKVYVFDLSEETLAFGNSTPESPLKKVENGRRKFEEIIGKKLARDDLVDELVKLLKCKDQHLPDDELLRRTSPETCEFLSSIFVQLKIGGYGTRTHSVILVDFEWNVEFVELTMREPIDIERPEWDVTVLRGKL